MSTIRLRRLLAAASGLAVCAAASGAWAQPAPAGPEAAPPDAVAQTSDSEVAEVVVTGTRAPRSRLDTLAPVDVVNTQTLTQQGTTELASSLSRIAPSLNFTRPAISDGSDTVRPATLRGLAPDQTLVLVNGARRHPSALVNVNTSIGRGSAAVDLNAIPSVAIDRVEILRDGAAAQYGSDAIAGVINLRLRRARSGGSAYATFGQYVSEVCTARQPNCRDARDGNTFTVAGWQGLPLGSEGFLTVSAEYRYRNPTNRSDLDPRVTPARVTARYGDPEQRDVTFYANAGTPIGAGWEAYAWLGLQGRRAQSAANPRLANNANNVASIFPNGFLPFIEPHVDDRTGAVGVRGPWSGFDVDLSLVYGSNEIHYFVDNTVNGSLGAASPTYFDAGVLFYDQWVANLDFTRELELGFNSGGPATLAFGTEYRNEGFQITAGEPASYIAGPLANVGGRTAGAQGFPGLQPSNEVDVSRNSYGLYADLDIPVTDRFDVDLAVRFEDYSDFGDTLNGKISARYEFAQEFAIRGSASTGFRAPALQQQYFTATSTNFIAIGGVQTPVEVGTFPATSVTARALGALPLTPEESVNLSIGGVFQSGGFELTVDAYRIEIEDRIVLSENIQGNPTGTPTQIAIFNLINPPGSASGLGAARFFINGVDTTTSGVDIVARYRTETDYGRFEFTGAANFNNTEVTRIPTTGVLSGLPVPPVLFDRANRLTFEEGTPDQKYTASVDWSWQGWSATARATYYGDVLQPDNAAALDFRTGDHTLVDLEARYRFANGFALAVGADNLFDEYPTATPTIANSNGPLGFPRYSPFGFNGRFVYARASVDW